MQSHSIMCSEIFMEKLYCMENELIECMEECSI